MRNSCHAENRKEFQEMKSQNMWLNSCSLCPGWEAARCEGFSRVVEVPLPPWLELWLMDTSAVITA